MKKSGSTAKSVSYRRCVVTPKPSQDLQQLLASALLAYSKPGDRYEPLNAQSTELRCIGTNYTHRGCLCGYMTSFERGAVQPVISDDPAAASLRLSALAPPQPKKGDAQQQYVPGVLYFVVHKNHVAVVQSHSMRITSFEAHLNWLLKSKTNQLAATDSFSLSDEAQKATKEKIKKSHVKSIALGLPLMSEVTVPPIAGSKDDASQTQKKENKKSPSRFRPEGPMLNLIRNLFNNENDFEKLGLEEVFDGNLEVWIEIRYPKRQRSQPEDAMRLMDTLGIALRDIEGDQVSLQLANGHKVSGKELKISGSVEVSMLTNKLPDEKELLDEMIAWLTAQINNGVVDP